MNQDETCFPCLMILQRQSMLLTSLSLLTGIRTLTLLEAGNSRLIRTIDVEEVPKGMMAIFMRVIDTQEGCVFGPMTSRRESWRTDSGRIVSAGNLHPAGWLYGRIKQRRMLYITCPCLVVGCYMNDVYLFMILKSSEFEIRHDSTTDCRVSCPLASKKSL